MAQGCDPHEICEECPEWIFTLADLLMCMMGLFVILWVLKPNVAGSEEQATREEIRRAETIRDIQVAFGARIDDNSEIEIELHELMRKLDQIKRNGAGEKGNAVTFAAGAEGTDSEVTRIRPGDVAGAGGRVEFDAASAELDEAGRATLDVLAGKLRGHRSVVLVKGHTAADDFPDAAEGGTADQHMALSLERAKAVSSYLSAQGVPADVLRVQGCGGFEPVRLRAYAEPTRRANRRVSVQATDQLVRDLADAPSTTPLLPPAPVEVESHGDAAPHH